MSVGMIFGSLAEKHRLAVAFGDTLTPRTTPQAQNRESTVATDAKAHGENLLPPIQVLDGNPSGEQAKASPALCTCNYDCVCKPSCWIDDNEPCQCKVGSEITMRGASERFGLPCENDVIQSCQTLQLFPFDNIGSPQQGIHASAMPCDADPTLIGYGSASIHDNIITELPGSPSVAKSNLQTLQSKKNMALPKGRQAVARRDKKSSNGKTKHAELPISFAALEKLKSNGFPMDVQTKGVEPKEGHKPSRGETLKPTKKKLKSSARTNTLPYKNSKVTADDTASRHIYDNSNDMQINRPSEVYRKPVVAFNACPSRKPALTLRDTSDQISQAGELVDDNLISEGLPAQPLPMENLSIWTSRFSGEGPNALTPGIRRSEFDDIETYMDTNGQLVSFNAAPFNYGFHWMKDFDNEMM